MNLRPVAPEEMGWLSDRSSWTPSTAARGILQENDGQILAMVIYDEWTPNAARIHVAVDRPAVCRSLVRAAFDYPFRQLGLDVLWATVPATNHKCTRLVQRLGFQEVHRILDGWKVGADLVVYEMRKAACRWLKETRQ